MSNRRAFVLDVSGASPIVRQKILAELNLFAAKHGQSPATTWLGGNSDNVKFAYSLSKLPVGSVAIYVTPYLDHVRLSVETNRLPRMIALAHFKSLKAHFRAAFLLEPRDPP